MSPARSMAFRAAVPTAQGSSPSQRAAVAVAVATSSASAARSKMARRVQQEAPRMPAMRMASTPQQQRQPLGVRSIFISARRQDATTASSSRSSSSPSSSARTNSHPSSSHKRDQDSTVASSSRPRRSLLYVPGSSEKMIKGSQKSDADCIIFDLEDSVAPHRKGAARETVLHGLNAAPRPGPELAVRINPPSGDISLASDDLDIVLPSHALQAIVIPKVESADDVFLVLDKAAVLRPEGAPPIALILSVESAASLHNMPTIIATVQQRLAELATDDQADPSAQSSQPPPPHAYLSALLFASEDFCAATSIQRTRSRTSLLVPRAQIVLTARAFGLDAIDMVCIALRDEAELVEETREGKELGFDGKQVIHPAQVGPVQRVFVPSEAEVRRAARIQYWYERGVAAHLGAIALPEEEEEAQRGQDGGNGGGGNAGGATRSTMIDAPMLKQAETTLAKAAAARIPIPDIAAEERAKSGGTKGGHASAGAGSSSGSGAGAGSGGQTKSATQG